MKDGLNQILVALSICSIIGAFLMWILGRILTDKKDKMVLQFEIEKLKAMVEDVKKDYSQFDKLLTEIEVIKEKIKHL
jgi:hypothetical protein